MCYSDFPAALFEIAGDPDTIRATGKKWKQFGTDCETAQLSILALDTSQFVGREADLYREGFTEAIPRELGATADAYLKVGTSIISLADQLSRLEDNEMTPLRIRAANLWDAYRESQERLTLAKVGDKLLGTAPGSPQETPSAQAAVDSLSAQWDAAVAAAADIKTRAAQVARECASTIRQLAGARFQANPAGVESARLNTRSFIVDHAAALDALSKALKLISTAATVIGFIPGVGWVAIPIAVGTGAAAYVIDASVAGAQGKANIPLMVVDGMLMAVPGGKLAGQAIRKTTELAYLAKNFKPHAGWSGNAPSAESALGGAHRLIGANRAEIDPRKLTEYALNPDHPTGGNKARVFEAALGFNKSNADDLITQLRAGLLENRPVSGKVDLHGRRFTVDIPVNGPTGSGVVRSGWILRPGSQTPSLTTVIVR